MNGDTTNLINGSLIADAILNEVSLDVSLLASFSNEEYRHYFKPSNGLNGKHVSDSRPVDVVSDSRPPNDSLSQLFAPPHLVVIIVGQRKDSSAYVARKIKACARVGIQSTSHRLDEKISEEKLLALVMDLNQKDDVDGILVQLPLPSHIDEATIIQAIDSSKDVDGLHPSNLGKLAASPPHADSNKDFDGADERAGNLIKSIKQLSGGRELQFFSPCTAEGVIELLNRSGVCLSGANVVVIGRSKLVGLPVSLLLQKQHATVTMCHSKSQDLSQLCRQADVVIAAIGRPQFINREWLKSGVVVIDVGINAVDDPTDKRGYHLCGDVDFKDVEQICSKITPVPGGVGPMTVAILMRNTLKSKLFKIAKHLRSEDQH